MAKTKDRWERVVDKVLRESVVDVEMLSKEEAVKLLRQEHRAVVRKVKGDISNYLEASNTALLNGYKTTKFSLKREALETLLCWLEERTR